MPLHKGTSKKSFDENVAIERNHGKPEAQSLAIAYAVRKKAKRQKMADGGDVLDTNARKHIKSKNFALPAERKYPIEDATHARNALARVAQDGSPAQQAEVRRKVHAKYPDMKAEGGELQPAAETSVRPDTGYGKIIMIKADGGKIEHEKEKHMKHGHLNMRIKKHPRMVESKLKAKFHDEEEMPEEQAPEEMQNPPQMAAQEPEEQPQQPMMADGGEIEEYGHEAEEDHAPMHLEDHMDESVPEDEYMDEPQHLAEGGEAEDWADEEEEMDEHASIAAAIMARKAARSALRSGNQDMDRAARYARGGEVDLEEEDMEAPMGKTYRDRNEAALHEHSDLDELHYMDDHDDTDPREEDEENDYDMDVVDKIRHSMKRRSPIGR